jgi:hypothetical protein
MKTIGLCTHFTETDDWALAYALNLARTRRWRLTICHWLESPYKIRRDIVYDGLFKPQGTAPATPDLLRKLELELGEYYEPKLGDFTDVAFKLCEGAYQVELVRCLRQHLLDLVAMGYQPPPAEPSAPERPLEEFAVKLEQPLLIVGRDGPGTFLINHKALEILDLLALPEGRWQVLEPAYA